VLCALLVAPPVLAQQADEAAISLLATLIAAAIQQLQIAMHPTYFNHNAIYHLLQAVALALLLVAFRGLIRQEELAPVGAAAETVPVTP